MPNDNSQAEPLEPITPEVVAENATPEGVSTPEQPQTEQPLTRDEVLAMMREVIPQAVQPMIQSQVAKGENRINQRITERLAALEINKGALNLSAEQVTQATKAIIEDETMKAYAPQTPKINGEENTQSAEPIDPVQFVYDQIEQSFELAGGTKVTPKDKEWAEYIEPQLNDPKGSLAKTQLASIDASRAKAQRVAAQQKKAPARVTSTGGASHGDAKPTASAHDAWDDAYKKG